MNISIIISSFKKKIKNRFITVDIQWVYSIYILYFFSQPIASIPPPYCHFSYILSQISCDICCRFPILLSIYIFVCLCVHIPMYECIYIYDTCIYVRVMFITFFFYSDYRRLKKKKNSRGFLLRMLKLPFEYY